MRQNTGLLWFFSKVLITIITLVVIALIHVPIVYALPDYGWAKTWGDPAAESYAYGTAADTSGNVYVVGYFNGANVDFDTSDGIDNHSSVGNQDAYVVKYDSNGGFLWARTWGSTGSDAANAVSVDTSGNVYITGNFAGAAAENVDFDGTSGTDNHIAYGNNANLFVTKYNSDGTYGWSQTLYGVANNVGLGIAVSSPGGVYITGFFNGIVDFDPTITTENHSNIANSKMFITKYNTTGTYLWTQTLQGTGSAEGDAITVDTLDNAYVGGYFANTVDFDPTGTTESYTYATTGGYVTKYDSSGNYLWVKLQIGAGAGNVATSYAIKSDGLDNIYTTGRMTGTIDFDPGAGTDNHTSNGNEDFFLQKLDSDGNYVWAKHIGGTTNQRGYGLAVDPSNNIYIGGFWSGTVDFDPSGGIDSKTDTSDWSVSMFASAYDISGNYLWTRITNNGQESDGYGISAYAYGIYLIGDAYGNVDFDPEGDGDIVPGATDWGSSALVKWITEIPPASPTPTPVSSSTPTPTPEILGTTTDVNTHCSEQPPDSAPNIFKISRSGTEVNIFYSPISSNVTTYQLMYGYKPADERFAVTFNAELSTGAMKYTVSDLVQTQTYSFWMRGVNDCMPGPWSNTYTTTGLWVSPDASPAPSTGPLSSSQPTDGTTPTDTTSTTTEPTTPTETTFEITVVDPLGLPIAGVPVSVTPATETIPTEDSTIKNDSSNNGTVSVTVLPGEYTVTTTYDKISYSQGVILSASTTSLKVYVPIPLKKSLERQVMDAPLDATYAVKAGLAGVVVNSTVASIVGLFVASNLILSSLFSIYTSTSRSFLKYPIDYLDSLIKFTTLSLSTKLAPIFPSLRRRKKSNGLVFDAYSFKPLHKVYVILFSSSGNLKTDFTDEYGRYNFEDVAPDDYQLRTEMAGYKFPSAIITTSKTSDIDHVYQPGEIIPVSQDINILREVAVPMDPSEKLGFLKQVKLELSRTIKKMVAPSYLISMLVVAAAVITNPSQFNQIITMLFGSFLLVKVNADKHYKRMSGQLLNPSKLPIADANVKLYKTYSTGERSSLYTTTKTDKSGRYYIQPEIGNYILEIMTNDGEKITQTVRIMKNVPTVDRVITVQNVNTNLA